MSIDLSVNEVAVDVSVNKPAVDVSVNEVAVSVVASGPPGPSSVQVVVSATPPANPELGTIWVPTA